MRSDPGELAGLQATPGNPSTTRDPISVRIAEAVRLTGISRSRIYELIDTGDLEVVKIGRSTFILFGSLKSLFEK